MLDSRINRLDRAFARFSTAPRFTSPPGPSAPINRLPNVAQPYRSLACWYHETYGNRATKCKGKPCPWPHHVTSSQKTSCRPPRIRGLGVEKF